MLFCYFLGGSIAIIAAAVLAAALLSLFIAVHAAIRGVGMLVAILLETKQDRVPSAFVSRRTINERYRDLAESERWRREGRWS